MCSKPDFFFHSFSAFFFPPSCSLAPVIRAWFEGLRTQLRPSPGSSMPEWAHSTEGILQEAAGPGPEWEACNAEHSQPALWGQLSASLELCAWLVLCYWLVLRCLLLDFSSALNLPLHLVAQEFEGPFCNSEAGQDLFSKLHHKEKVVWQ